MAWTGHNSIKCTSFSEHSQPVYQAYISRKWVTRPYWWSLHLQQHWIKSYPQNLHQTLIHHPTLLWVFVVSTKWRWIKRAPEKRVLLQPHTQKKTEKRKKMWKKNGWTSTTFGLQDKQFPVGQHLNCYWLLNSRLMEVVKFHYLFDCKLVIDSVGLFLGLNVQSLSLALSWGGCMHGWCVCLIPSFW